MKILILEDDVHLLKVLVKVMSMYGEYYATDNGADAVRVFDEAMTEGAPFQLALLDIMLPGMDGYEVLSYIRRIEAAHKRDGLDGVKVVMVTALNAAKNIMHAFQENCEAYLTKPYSTDQLEETLENLGIRKIHLFMNRLYSE
ncbi:MAG: response regulator [Candidatus Kapaibacterium sp.]|nr:MAG: response regulator [Candidatus Kapabacteria bacterium]